MTACAATPDISPNKFICSFFSSYSFCYSKCRGTESHRWFEIQILVLGRSAWIEFSLLIAYRRGLQLKKNEVSLILCQEAESGVGCGLSQHDSMSREVQIMPQNVHRDCVFKQTAFQSRPLALLAEDSCFLVLAVTALVFNLF